MTTAFLPWLYGITFFLLIVGLVWGLGFAPPDYQMGDNYRIVYIHVPSASIALGGYAMMACMAAMHMIWKIKMADIVAKAIAPVGGMFCALCLFSGSFWGKPTWGTYWVWDARITSTLILLFVYVGVAALRNAFDSENAGSKAASVLTIVGIVNLPIIHYSVNWWNTLHQVGSDLSLQAEGANPPEIWIPAFFMGFALLGIFLLAIILRSRNEILVRERRTQWVQDLLDHDLQEGLQRA
ncbi:MAG: heme ABC transporter permease CcmC [Pseudomonadota bacterium]